mmetsp:Transcript_19043/g.43807  ORF Transcript_19043/g.43807 Transcript_19043/m.43807 type:complete len:86 (+) Transcript_19043:69-326(+)
MHRQRHNVEAHTGEMQFKVSKFGRPARQGQDPCPKQAAATLDKKTEVSEETTDALPLLELILVGCRCVHIVVSNAGDALVCPRRR